jgi:hypothetical protein
MSQTLPVNLAMGVKIWWSYMWRAVVYGLIIGLVLGIFKLILPPVKPLTDFLILFSGIPIGIYIMRTIFSKRYSNYEILLRSTEDNQPIGPNWYAGLCLWWSLLWRCILLTTPFFILSVSLVGGDLIKAAEKKRCMTLSTAYQQYSKDPALIEQAQTVMTQYNKIDCNAILAEAEKEKTAPSQSKQSLGPSIFGILLGIPVGLFIQFKIFQILLRKRYRRFYVSVQSL